MPAALSLYGQSPDSILTGSYLNSSPNKEFSLYDYSVVKPLGFNTVIQRAVISIPEINQLSNSDSLKQFSYLIAANDSVPESAKRQENIDWVYYFSNALYSRWIPEKNTLTEIPNTIGLQKKFGFTLPHSVSTGVDTSNVGKVFIDGPNYTQYQKYVYTNKYNSNKFITYKVNFRLKRGEIFGSGTQVCKLQVIKSINGHDICLTESLITVEMLTNNFKTFQLSYEYDEPGNSPLGRGEGMLPPTTIPPKEEVHDSYLDTGAKIQFRIIWLGNAELFLEYVDVYDKDIWENWFVKDRAARDGQICEYLARFQNLTPHLKYFLTIDEPHSFDSYVPVRIVQHLLDSLGSPVKLDPHIYATDQTGTISNIKVPVK
ncbi:MAG: hypothetical protein B6D45_06950 [Ignavibacteriales bacterium UTCHB3]|nr:MAG: hypothetical protein B6D45_06950 [Ignavibacteriales bacterium UTCHB3]